MATLDSINEHLLVAAEELDRAAEDIRDLPLEPVKKHLRNIGTALVAVFEIQHSIYSKRPDLAPEHLNDEMDPDPEVTDEERQAVQSLGPEYVAQVDQILLSHAQQRWRKVAMLVGLTMMDAPDHWAGMPDVFYAERVRSLVEEGRLESEGNLRYMRYSEVRLPSEGELET